MKQPRLTLVYGLGRSGLGTVRHLARLGWPAEWFDLRPQEAEAGAAGALGIGPAPLPLEAGRFDLVVAAPGVPIDHPDLDRLRAGGAEVIGEAELCYRTLPTPLIGITGTAGKGSTTAWITRLLRGQGLDAREGGNTGTPLLDVAEGAEVAVVELSSFQLERVRDLHLRVAVITNLDVDHLDRHGSVAAYHAAKLRILSNLGPGDAAVLPESLEVMLPAGCRLYRVPPRGTSGGWLTGLDGEPLLDAAELPPGQHPQNAASSLKAALAYLALMGRPLDLHSLKRDLRDFHGLPGRFETVAEVRGTRFIEDSIATRTLAVKAALEAAPAPVAWIVGGIDKGAAVEPLLDVVREKVSLILAVGRDGPALAGRFAPTPVRVIAESDGDAALAAACAAGLEAAPGGSVLLAPLGTSFDQFRDYRHRGEAFRLAARALAAWGGSQA